jgi:hypothetical protein
MVRKKDAGLLQGLANGGDTKSQGPFGAQVSTEPICDRAEVQVAVHGK